MSTTSPHKMRLATAIVVVQQAVEAQIDARRAACERDRELLLLLGRLDPSHTQTPAKTTTPPVVPTKRPAAGTIPGRVLDIVGEFDAPVSMKQILAAKHGAKDHHITSAVTQLVRGGHLIAEGGTVNRRYSLPVKKGGK
jgi:hypothetical protein